MCPQDQTCDNRVSSHFTDKGRIQSDRGVTPDWGLCKSTVDHCYGPAPLALSGSVGHRIFAPVIILVWASQLFGNPGKNQSRG